jgi:nitrite reductase/ring-hydroxylating ferredoxin subunit
VEVAGEAVCVVRVAGGVFAFDDVCPHRGTPLSLGRLDGTTLTCSMHQWEFDVTSGKLLRLRAPACLRMREARERDGAIEVEAA